MTLNSRSSYIPVENPGDFGCRSVETVLVTCTSLGFSSQLGWEDPISVEFIVYPGWTQLKILLPKFPKCWDYR